MFSAVDEMRVECLSCGHQRTLARPDGRVVSSGECDHCGYLGWAPAGQLNAEQRRLLRELPVERRHASAPAPLQAA
jgi:hypothetical protein